jgi:hypothetical protein
MKTIACPRTTSVCPSQGSPRSKTRRRWSRSRPLISQSLQINRQQYSVLRWNPIPSIIQQAKTKLFQNTQEINKLHIKHRIPSETSCLSSASVAPHKKSRPSKLGPPARQSKTLDQSFTQANTWNLILIRLKTIRIQQRMNKEFLSRPHLLCKPTSFLSKTAHHRPPRARRKEANSLTWTSAIATWIHRRA